jgi:hypothetical protein
LIVAPLQTPYVDFREQLPSFVAPFLEKSSGTRSDGSPPRRAPLTRSGFRGGIAS